MPGRSAFCKPMPKQVSPSATQQTGATSTQIKLEPSTPPANAKSETELFECLQVNIACVVFLQQYLLLLVFGAFLLYHSSKYANYAIIQLFSS